MVPGSGGAKVGSQERKLLEHTPPPKLPSPSGRQANRQEITIMSPERCPNYEWVLDVGGLVGPRIIALWKRGASEMFCNHSSDAS